MDDLLETICFEDGFGSHLLVMDGYYNVIARAHTWHRWLDAMQLTDFFRAYPDAQIRFNILQGDLDMLIANSDFS